LTNGGYKALAIGPATAANYPASLQIRNLIIDAPADSSNLLLLNYAGSTPLTVSENLRIGAHGALLSYASALNAQTLTIDAGGRATFANSALALSSNLNVNGDLVLSNATLASQTFTMDGTFNQYSGSNYVGDYMISGRNAAYELFGGVLSANRLILEGTPFHQSGGSNFISSL